jgi:hypothetical protein
MKTALEIAMERLASIDPDGARPLSAQQKTELAEIDSRFKAKWAEREIFLKRKLEEVLQAGNWQEAEQVQEELRREKIVLDKDREEAKNRVRNRAV